MQNPTTPYVDNEIDPMHDGPVLPPSDRRPTPLSPLPHEARADALVVRAGADVLTGAAGDRLRDAVATHNDGRVRRHLLRAAAARDAAADATDPDTALRLSDAWARHLHCALDESWPIGHPAHRRHD